MYFKRIKASNFKSFKDVEISLDKFNTIIGPNASGKSNFLSIIRFFKDIFTHGLENAIFLHGNINSIKNVALNQKNIILDISMGVDKAFKTVSYVRDNKRYMMEVKDSDYSLNIEIGKNQRDFKITYERYRIQVIIYDVKENDEDKDKFIEITETAREGFVTIIKEGKEISFENEPEDLPIEKEFILIFGEFYENENMEPFFGDTILINNPLILPVNHYVIRSFFEGISLYDIDPKLPKRAMPFTGKKELEENGRNIAIVLNNIFQNKKKTEKFNRILNDLLPFADDLIVDRLRDETFITCLKECYYDHYFPAYLLSDGTINIVAMILILFFEEKSVIVLEEPGRNLHPLLLSRIINMMEDVSQELDKQIIITTHNPEIVRYTDQKKLIVISRDADGFSQLNKLSEKVELKTFLKDIGLADLFLEGIL